MLLHRVVVTILRTTVLFIFLRKMIGTEDQELMFWKEVILHELYQYKDGSRERGQCLDRIAESLNFITTVRFKVDHDH